MEHPQRPDAGGDGLDRLVGVALVAPAGDAGAVERPEEVRQPTASVPPLASLSTVHEAAFRSRRTFADFNARREK